MSLDIILLKLLPHLPGANELTYLPGVMPYSVIEFGKHGCRLCHLCQAITWTKTGLSSARHKVALKISIWTFNLYLKGFSYEIWCKLCIWMSNLSYSRPQRIKQLSFHFANPLDILLDALRPALELSSVLSFKIQLIIQLIEIALDR